MRIAIDIDSTLHPYWDQFSGAAARRFGVELPYEGQLTWRVPQLEPEQLQAVIEDTHRDEAILAAEPYPGAVEAIARWHAEGHWIHITSHRADRAHAATADWLERIDLPHHDLHCSYDKISRCRELEIEVLIDDSPVNLARARDAGIVPATIVHPWNRELSAEQDVVCGRDWPELAAALAPLLAAAARARPGLGSSQVGRTAAP